MNGVFERLLTSYLRIRRCVTAILECRLLWSTFARAGDRSRVAIAVATTKCESVCARWADRWMEGRVQIIPNTLTLVHWQSRVRK